MTSCFVPFTLLISLPYLIRYITDYMKEIDIECEI